MQTTRRTVLQGAAALALPWRLARAANPPSPVILKLGNYMAEAAGRALPAEAAPLGRRHPGRPLSQQQAAAVPLTLRVGDG